MDLIWTEGQKLLAAVAAGALIGLEREWADKPAGFRTNILICLGAAIFTLLSLRLADAAGVVDRTRIAAQIVTGVGFLGAGAIIQFRGNVIGLTTAATIWAVASVGMAFGAGEFLLGALGTGLCTAVLFGLRAAEARIGQLSSSARLEIELDASVDANELLQRVIRAAGVRCRSLLVSRSRDSQSGMLRVVGSVEQINELERVLWREPSVRVLKRL